MACDGCGALIASRVDDCDRAQETRFSPAAVVWEDWGDEAGRVADPFELIADWDQAPPDTRKRGWLPNLVRERPELVATRWRAKRVKEDLFRDDPPA